MFGFSAATSASFTADCAAPPELFKAAEMARDTCRKAAAAAAAAATAA
jgi:hypothetical protein